LSNLRRDTNRYFTIMGEAISSMKDSIRDLIYGKKIRSFKVLSPLLLLLDGCETASADKLKKLWDSDLVHLVQEEYPRLLQGILDISEEGTLTHSTSDTANGSTINPHHFKRKSWIDNNDTLAHRNYGANWRRDSYGGSRPQLRGRGKAGARGRGVYGRISGATNTTEHAATRAGPTEHLVLSSFFLSIQYKYRIYVKS
jgi:hypothetical protein